ncbi:hypothetical protein Ahia01_001380000, partial [Argonauta hians]
MMCDSNPDWTRCYPCRVEGWLNVWEYDARAYDDQSLGETYPEMPNWEPKFCVLLQNIKKFYHYSSEEQAKDVGYKDLPRIRIDGGRDEFEKYWGYDTLESIKENTVQQHRRRCTH